MTKERGLRPTSPIHVHVDDTPVHVHVKKGKKKGLIKSASNQRLQKSTVASRARARSVSPRSGPWVPAPGKATRGGRVTWQGPTHKLEINQLRASDLSTDDEEKLGAESKQYEKKISHLMNEVGTLKNEVVLQKALQEIEQKEDLLNTSSRVIERQEAELDHVEEELAVTETENKILRQNMGLLQEEAEITNSDQQRLSDDPVNSSRSQKDLLNYEREKLMKKLIEVEMDGQAATQQVRELRELLRRTREDHRLSAAEQNRLTKQKQLFLESLADFEATNRALRRLLRDQHRMEATGLRLSEQRDVLMRKLADADMANERLKSQVLDYEGLIADLRQQLRVEKEERLALSNLQGSLESTRGHLQKQLRTKEADCNRMAVQIKNLEGQLAQERIQKEHLQETVSTSRDRVERDKDALKKAASFEDFRGAQKNRSEQLEAELALARQRLQELECQGTEKNAQLSTTSTRMDFLQKEKEMLIRESDQYRARITELEALVDRVEENAKAQNESLTARLHEKMTENTNLRLEIERMKSSVAMFESKIKQGEEDVQQLKSTVKQYEKLIDEYKEQASRTRNEADESFIRLEEQAREKERIQREGELELDKVKQRLHQRLQELEPLPEMLRATELKLHEANEKLLMYERRNSDSTRLIAELTAKVESSSETLDQFKSRCHDSQDNNRSLQSKCDSLERRLRELEEQNLELHTVQAKQQEAVHQDSLRLEEKTRENASLTRQLETALADNRKQQEHARDRYASKERTYQSRIVDLETQLSKLRSDEAKLKREKEENERRFNSRLYDLKDRLEQCHSTNRSMQNYVQFLKNSYSNVFGETGSSFPAPPSPVKPYP